MRPRAACSRGRRRRRRRCGRRTGAPPPRPRARASTTRATARSSSSRARRPTPPRRSGTRSGSTAARPRGGTRFDAAALARSSARRLVVLNGPRHFLMDSASGRDRRRALLPRHADAPRSRRSRSARRPTSSRRPTPTARSTRRNTWRWKRGRTVFELVAPGGDTYVMQSYAQIRDPELTIGKLRALGRAARPARRAGATARGGCARRSSLTRQRRGDDPPGRPAEHLPARDAPRAGRSKRTRHAVSIDRQHAHRHAPPTPGTDRGPRHGHGHAVRPRLDRARRDADRRAAAGTFRLLLRARDRSPARVDMPFTIAAARSTSAARHGCTGGTGAYRGITSGALQARDTQHARRPERHGSPWTGTARF